MEISNGGIGVSNCSSPLACTIASSQITFVDPKTSGMCATPVKTSITNLINTAAMRLQVNAFSTDHSWIEYPTFGITPGGLQGHSITMIDSQNKFLVYGGQMVSGALSSTLYLFEFDAIQWSVVQPSSAIQPPPLINHAAIFCNATQELVLFGGSTSINSLNNAIWKFNIKTNLWTQVLVVDYSPGFRTLQAFDGVDGKLYVWGGQDSTRNVKGDLWQFNILTSQWQQYSLNSVTPSGKYGSVMRIVNNTNLLLFGGNNGQTDTNELWSFDINLQTWHSLIRIQRTDLRLLP
ncbi:galactose oxidase [Rhizoclosmatium globosum]|uniref:Galactose oxidase n=1 Tax=Rhizoclosmatium globosum TaxID=329046 RepID=A0A1Y2BZX0_9FUNG|nr:galactose oxidase [Rhizoclosmatium globosum]|eukprot:ORY40343.1 galactose oxidase [Rhizoclosmatium globosum]